MPSSFVERQIILTIALQARQGLPSKGVEANANPTFAGTNSNTVRIVGGGTAKQNGLRISARIARAGAPGFGEATVQIYNLPKTLIAQLNTLGVPFVYQIGANTITIEAGDAGVTPTKIFSGTINNAYADFSGVPDSIFNIVAQAGPLALQGATTAPARGYQGSSSVATIMANLAKQVGYGFVNNFPAGAAPVLSNCYLCGSVRDQLRDFARSGAMVVDIDDVAGLIKIGPKNGTLSAPTAPIPVIGPPPIGKMVGYPGYTTQGVRVRTEFDGSIAYGTTVEVRGSSVENANGKWVIYALDHDLECQAPDGPWFTNLELASLDFPVLPQLSAAP